VLTWEQRFVKELGYVVLTTHDSMGFIDLDRVSRWYGTHQALRDVSLHLQPGRIGLLGPNGAGKSTLLKILLGLMPPSTGAGRVLGHNLAQPEKTPARVPYLQRFLASWLPDLRSNGSDLRRAIGYMPEADALIPGLRGSEYVALAGELYGMPRREAQRRAHEVLTYLELEDARYRRLEEYSTGMKQRLKLAQALVHDPPVLLLDEPTSGLDPAGREAMLKLLLTLGKEHGKSFLLSTHLLGDVERVCDSVVILHHGQVLRQGSVDELRTRRQDRYRLQVQGDRDAFLEELRLEGVQIIEDNGRGELSVVVPEGWATRAFLALADNHGVLLRGFQRDDEGLEELFHRVLAENAEHGR
jgi:ABC-2 type transport system ATP-binding protein